MFYHQNQKCQTRVNYCFLPQLKMLDKGGYAGRIRRLLESENDVRPLTWRELKIEERGNSEKRRHDIRDNDTQQRGVVPLYLRFLHSTLRIVLLYAIVQYVIVQNAIMLKAILNVILNIILKNVILPEFIVLNVLCSTTSFC